MGQFLVNFEKIKAKKRLFMTATPRYFQKSKININSDKLGSADDLNSVSMDNEQLFGKEFHELNFRQAIDNKILSDYRIEIVGITDDDLLEQISMKHQISISSKDDGQNKNELNQKNSESLALIFSLFKIIKKHSLKNHLVFLLITKLRRRRKGI